jgi:hypothetical protein
MATPNNVDVRLHALKAVNAILAALQSTFARPDLLGISNEYLFNPEDPKNSRLWICDPGSHEKYDRSGNRMLVMVQRGEFQPMDMHLHNVGQGSFSDPAASFTDLCRTPIFIRCEAGNSLQSETLASVCYQVLKFFRRDLAAEFDLHELVVSSVSPASQIGSVSGSPWVTTVTCRVDTQEMFQLFELGNDMNKFEIIAKIKKTVASFDAALTRPIEVLP